MARLADIALAAGKTQAEDREAADIITFIQSEWGLNVKLFPVQRVILKAHYGIPLDDNPYGLDLSKPVPKDHPAYEEITELPRDGTRDFEVVVPKNEEDPTEIRSDLGYYKNRVRVTDWRRKNVRYMSEAEYLRYIYDQGRCNIREVIPGEERRELVLAIGRRSGKTFMCACVMAYEVYKLLLKGDPQLYYGLPKTNVIQLISVATDKDQASLLYNEASGHFSNCTFYKPYTANNTMSYAKFQTPEDIESFGRYSDDPTAKATVKVSFKSCVAKGLRGAGNILIILDELAHFNAVGQSDAQTIYRAVKPSLAAYSPKDPKNKTRVLGPVEGRILSISSPLGRQGFFYQKYRQGFAGGMESSNMLCIQAPTWEVNPTVEASFLTEEYATDAISFFTEYGADFSDRTRGWLTPDQVFACVDPRKKMAKTGGARVPHFMGIDISAGQRDGDYCAVAIGHLEEDGHVHLDYIERIRAGEGAYEGQDRISFSEIVDWIYDLSRKFYIEKGMFDQWAGIPFETELHKKGLTQCESVFFTKPLTSQVFANFKQLMLEEKIHLFDDPKDTMVEGELHAAYIAELLELQAEQHAKYIITVEAPDAPDKYDDYSDALVRMVWQASKYVGNRKYISNQANAPRMAQSRAMREMRERRRTLREHFNRTVPRKMRRR